MAKIISIANQKGGVGKTTTTTSIGSILASQGFKVLLLDLDDQNDLTLSLPISLSGQTDLFKCIFELGFAKGVKVNPNLVVIPGSPKLQPINFSERIKQHEAYEYENPRFVLKKFLTQIKDKCDFILMDCPPNEELIVQNAFAASDYVIIPTIPHSFSINGVNAVLRLIQKFQKINPELEPLGILITIYDKRNNIDKGVYELCLEQYPSLLFKTPIRINSKLRENSHLGIEIIEYAKQLAENKYPSKFTGYEEFLAVTDELIGRLKMSIA
ncbi:MAG: ParA family protein [bacterium]|nr:ParA family protein [bacterium]